MTNINENILLANGYREWKNSGIINRNSKRFFQKRFRNTKGKTMFFITIYEYEHEKNELNYEVDLQFEKEDYTMNIKFFGISDSMTIEDIEREVFALWYVNKCKYYEDDE